jgi:hypothetical protein
MRNTHLITASHATTPGIGLHSEFGARRTSGLIRVLEAEGGLASLTLIGIFLACSAVASNSPISDAAYTLLLGRTQTNRQAFYVYWDADSAFNHGFPSGLFGTTSKIHIDAGAIDDLNSATGVSTNMNSLDRQLGNVLRISFDPFSSGEFAGVNIEEPEGWGVSQAGRGYDLTGVTQAVVRLRSPTPGGIAVQFGVAGLCFALCPHCAEF